VTQQQHLLVFADSLAFHGPTEPMVPSHPDLYPNVCATSLGPNVRVDLVARLGATARDGWWALTKDPVVWGEYLPRADAVVLSLGHMDQLPASIPTCVGSCAAVMPPPLPTSSPRLAGAWPSCPPWRAITT
jgi:hypothetical protein